MTIITQAEPKRRGTPEGSLLRACLDLLAAERIWHRRWNAGATRIGERFIRFGQKGDADIIFSMNGRLCWIECKATKGRQSLYQKAFQQEAEEFKHTYLLIRDVSELQKWIKEWR